MASTDTFPLVDRIVDGGLTAFLGSARSAGESYERIARRLAIEHSIDVTSETVRQWCIRVTAPTPSGRESDEVRS